MMRILVFIVASTASAFLPPSASTLGGRITSVSMIRMPDEPPGEPPAEPAKPPKPSPLLPTVDGASGQLDVVSRLLKDRILLLGTDVNDEVANVLVAQLLYLANEDP